MERVTSESLLHELYACVMAATPFNRVQLVQDAEYREAYVTAWLRSHELICDLTPLIADLLAFLTVQALASEH